MRSVLVVVVSAAALIVLSTAAGSRTTLPRMQLYPNAVAFADATHGALGTGQTYRGRHRGAIELTSDGGRTWHVLLTTPSPVLEIGITRQRWYAKLRSGETLKSTDAGHHWARTSDHVWSSAETCGTACGPEVRATPADPTWSLVTSEPGAGFQGKAVSRKLDGTWKRVACTNFMDAKFFCHRSSYGGIGTYGYAEGIAGNTSGFGLIWEGRGFLYATRDGGRRWSVAKAGEVSDEDFGSWATVVPHGRVGFVLLFGGGHERLVETTDAGRTWHVVHRWK